MDNRIVVVAGPTASGKTRLGIELAQALGGEIVSADSMQIYRRMDIGTAKATKEERAAAVHHMLDVADPAESWSVARYVEEASRCCDDIIARGRLPIVVGGTGLYIDSLVSGLDFADNTSDNALRDKLGAEYDSLGGDAMLARLAQFDPERAAKLHPGDKRRIVRAIEIYLLTGTTITEHDRITAARPKRYDAARIVLNYADRADLYARIDARVDAMEQAVGREGPPDDGSLVFHDDRGAQYTSRSFQRCLDSHGIVQSVSRPGTPLDNAVAESFFKTLKRELVKERSYGTRDEAKQDIFKYIELYYNRVRMHSTLGYMSPVEYERQYA